jgi:GntR family transcriptional regulator
VPSSSLAPRSAPRYRQLARTLIAEIEGGRYGVGAKLPIEEALCRQFGASRHTVRSAIEQLVRLGMVTRAPRIGTVVSALRPEARFRMGIRTVADLLQYAARTRMVVLEAEPVVVGPDCDDSLADFVGQTWLRVVGLRHELGDDRPNCHHEVWIAPDYRGVRGVTGALDRPIFDLVSEQFGVEVSVVRQETRATTLSRVVAQRLGVEPLGAALWVRRRYLDDRGRLLEVSINVHPADAFTYELEIRRDVPG